MPGLPKDIFRQPIDQGIDRCNGRRASCPWTRQHEDGYCKRCQHYVAVKPSEQNGVYLIAKPYHLAWFRDYVNGTIVDEGEAAGTTHPSASAMLTADIDLKNYCHAAEDGKELLSWIPIGYVNNSWEGNMDGQGHTISHLYIKTAQSFVGFSAILTVQLSKTLSLTMPRWRM